MNRSLWITWNLIFCWLKVWLNQVSRGVWCIASQCGAAKGWSPGKNRPKDRRIDESCLTKHLYLALPRRPEKNRRKQAQWLHLTRALEVDDKPFVSSNRIISFMVPDTDGSSTLERRKIFMNENQFGIDTILRRHFQYDVSTMSSRCISQLDQLHTPWTRWALVEPSNLGRC